MTMKTPTLGLTILVALVSVSAVSEEPLIVPAPKYMGRGEWDIKLSTADKPLAAIVIEPSQPKLAIGAQEINRFMADRGGKPLPVYDLGSQPDDLNTVIYLIADAKKLSAGSKLYGDIENTFTVSDTRIPEARRTKQAYLMRCPGQGFIPSISGEKSSQQVRILLAGYGEQGGLYAAVTFCHLLKNVDSTVCAYRTNIDDYPDFGYRGRVSAGKVLFTRGYLYHNKRLRTDKPYWEALKEFVNLNLHLKMNYMAIRRNLLVHDSKDYYDKILQYAKDRGFECSGGGSSLFNLENDEQKKEFEDYLKRTKQTEQDFNIVRGSVYCWSEDELIRKMVRRSLAKGITLWQYHCPDTGDENWGQRCDECRKKFGSDRAKADAHVLNIIHQELRNFDSEIKLLAIIHPYHATALNPEYNEYAEEYRTFYSRLCSMIPEDVWMCTWLRDRESMQIWHETTRRPTYIYHAVLGLGSGWPILNPTVRSMKSGYRPERTEDMMTVPALGGEFWYVLSPLAAEYSWNTEAPGGGEIDMVNYFGFDVRGKTDADFFQRTVPRAAEYIWGKAAAPLMTEVYQSGLYWRLATQPRMVVGRVNRRMGSRRIKLTYADMEFHENAATRVCELCLPIMKKKVPVLSDFLVCEASELYKKARAASIFASVYKHYFAAVNAVEDEALGKASEEIAKARETVTGIKDKLERIREEVEPFPQIGSARRFVQRLDSARQTALKAIGDFHVPTKEEIQKSTMSPDLIDEVKNRKIRAVRTETPPKLDGRLDDGCWASHKYPIRNFVRYPFRATPKLAFDQTDLSVCYDSQNLYLAFAVYDSEADSLVGKEHDRDSGALFKEDIIEIFLNPNTNTGDYAQLVANIAGSKFDIYKRVKRKGAPKRSYMKDWNPQWITQVSLDRKDGWTLEVAIPFEIFMTEPCRNIDRPPRAGDVWRVNFFRERRTLENSGVKWMESNSNREVSEFAPMFFVDG